MVEPSALEIPDERFRAVYAQAVNEMGRLPIPGAVVGVLHEGKALIAAFGVTSVEHPLPVPEHTLFQVGSITKTFVATAAMRLVEAGKTGWTRRSVPTCPSQSLRTSWSQRGSRCANF
jgi:CubicO group peptidase (beta-lactamase class C family)